MIEAIRNFLWVHPWWHATGVAVLVAIPSAVALFFSWRDGVTADEANRLRGELSDATNRIANLQKERNSLEAERNSALAQIAENVRRPLTQAQQNAAKLRQYLGKTAKISEGDGSWGAMGAEIVNISDDSIVTLFVPAGFSSTTAYSVLVHCDKLQVVEEPMGGCALQIRILERYGDTVHWGEIRKWEERRTSPSPPRARGSSVFHSNYHLAGSSSRRGVHVYAPTNGNPEYTLVSFADGSETGALYGDRVEISKKFALLQIEWLTAGYLRDGGGSGGSSERLFLFTN